MKMGLFDLFLKNGSSTDNWVVRDSSLSFSKKELVRMVREKFNPFFKKNRLGLGDILLVRNPQTSRFLPLLMSAFESGVTVLPIYERVSCKEEMDILEYLKPKAVFDMKTDDFRVNESSCVFCVDEPGVIFQSSGTTGRPKLIFQSESNLIGNAEVSILKQNIVPASRCYSVLTLSHTGGLNMQVLPTLLAGGSVFIDSHFGANAFVERVQRINPTHFILVPSHYRYLKQSGLFSLLYNPKVCPLVLSGSEPVPNDFYHDVREVGGEPLSVYGLTEVGPFVCSNNDERKLPHGALSCLGRFEGGYEGKVSQKSIIEVCGPGLNHFVVSMGGHELAASRVADGLGSSMASGKVAGGLDEDLGPELGKPEVAPRKTAEGLKTSFGSDEPLATARKVVGGLDGSLGSELGKPEVTARKAAEGLEEGRRLGSKLGKHELAIKKVAEKWFVTGDYGVVEDDVFFFSGRGDYEVNLGGFKFSLYEVEEQLRRLPFVVDCRVFKVSDPVWYEIPCADVVLSEKGGSVPMIRAELKKLISPLKVPRKINIVESLERTSINKVRRGRS